MAMPQMSEAAFNDAVAVQIRASFVSNEFGIAVMNAYDSCLKANEDVDPCNVGGNVPQSGMFKGLKAGRVLADKGNINFHASTAGSANVHSG